MPISRIRLLVASSTGVMWLTRPASPVVASTAVSARITGIPAAGLARPVLVRDRLRADGGPERDGDDHERQPAQDGRPAVSGAPGARPCCEIPSILHDGSSHAG